MTLEKKNPYQVGAHQQPPNSGRGRGEDRGKRKVSVLRPFHVTGAGLSLKTSLARWAAGAQPHSPKSAEISLGNHSLRKRAVRW